MADHTKIEWCDATVNFWAGCTKVSPACDNCYAEKMAGRLWGLKWGPGERRQHFLGAVETLAKLDRKAQKLGTRLSVFINSLADLFDNEVDDADRMDAFEAMAMFRNLVFLVLTKRIGNVAPYLQRDSLAFDLIGEGRVWLGITVCNQAEADRDIPKLLAVPAAKRFLSMEPLLGPVDLGAWIGDESCHVCRTRFYGDEMNLRPGGVKTVDFEDQPEDENDIRKVCPNCQTINTCGEVDVVDEEEMGGGIDWVIVGGESGPNARPMHPDWARSLRDQCQAAGVPFLFKQWGEFVEWTGAESPSPSRRPWMHVDDPMPMVRVGKEAAGRLLDGVEHNGRPA